jgi:hypothetical protein
LTVCDAAGHLAASFRSHFQPSPLHLKGSSQLLPTVRSLLKAFDNADPPPRHQKAITPKFLQKFYRLLAGKARSAQHPAYAQTANITLGAYFFAMRSCEYTKTKQPGCIKRVGLGCIIFCTRHCRVIQHSDPNLLSLTAFITIVFEDQKNGKKMDVRTQGLSGHQFLCPILCWGPAAQKIIATIPKYNGQTNLCSVFLNGEVLDLSNSFIRKLLRHTCDLYGGLTTFGFHSHEIGNRSIRSRAAMALFLMDHSPAKIMILG